VWLVPLLTALLGALFLASFGCTSTTLEYVDPARPEATVRVHRTTFMRNGVVEVDFPVQTTARIEDRPISPSLASLLAGLGCVVGAVLGAPAGPVGAGIGCAGGGILGGAAGLVGQDDEAQPELAPPLRKREERRLPPTSRSGDPLRPLGPLAFWCGRPTPQEWCP
jgi:hypothetical protein